MNSSYCSMGRLLQLNKRIVTLLSDSEDIKEMKNKDYEVKTVEAGDEFRICPSCGYKDGFHSMFRKEGGKTKWLFICPSCHSVFDIGYTV